MATLGLCATVFSVHFLFGLSFHPFLSYCGCSLSRRVGKELRWEHSHTPAAFSRSGTNPMCVDGPTLPRALSKPPVCSVSD